MVLPPGGFFVLGSWLLVFALWEERRQRKRTQAQALLAAGRD
jgi:hypothetical protein